MGKRVYTEIKACRICGSRRLKDILELGKQPPANSLRRSLKEKVPFVPLTLCFCPGCSTVQLKETIDPSFLFRNYFWVTGTSSTARSYSSLFYNEAVRRCQGRGRLFCAEVASNDGTFLKPFLRAGHSVLGIDPAKNIAQKANKEGVPTIADFFGEKAARSVVEKYGQADFVFARNVVPHVADVNDVVAGMGICLKPQGTGAIEFHYARIILEELHYDSIYHEHLFYYSLKSLLFLLAKHGLYAFDVMKSPISGGSLVVYFSKIKRPVSDKLKAMLAREKAAGVGDFSAWKKFAKECALHRKRLLKIIENEVNSSGKLTGYGSSARSSTLLNFCGINKEHICRIADQNPLKNGRYTAGTDVKIVSPEKAFNSSPKAVFLMAWNFKDEILANLKNLGFSGRVIVPLPRRPYVLEI